MPPSTVGAVVLLGWMEEAEAISYLLNQCCFDPPLSIERAAELWNQYHQKVIALPDRRNVPPPITAPIQAAHQGLVRNFLSRHRGPEVTGVINVDPRGLVICQLYVVTERALSRHKRKCTVCQHPERDLIEQEFLHWRSTRSIAKFYQLTDRAVYRHAHALVLAPNPQPPASNLRFLIDSPNRERFHATHSKQTIEVHSNRQKNTTFHHTKCSRFFRPPQNEKPCRKALTCILSAAPEN